jgi:trk system potassium uptake protein TrkH
MNFRRVFHILGLVLFILAGAQLLPLAWCLEGGESRAAIGFITGAVCTGLVGLGLRISGHAEGELFRREGVLIVVGAWVLASIAGAIPYVVSGVLPSPVEALFESTSGFTTTGATVLTDIEAAGHPILFWRSFTQWLGGIGIVVLFVALLSELGPGARFLFKLEVPGPKAQVLHARVQDTALALARIYLALSAIELLLLLVAGLGFFDALTHTFSTVSTGGFSPHPESISRFSVGVQFIVLLFMLAAGVNFSLYFSALRRRSLESFRDVELRVYGALLVVAVLAVGFDLLQVGDASFARTLLDASFQVVSILTTTGFSTVDFSNWPDLSRSVLVALMIFGGCAGSTAGGVKVVRAIVGWKAAMREVRLTFNPNSVVAITVGRGPVPEESVRSVVALIVLWVIAWGAGTVLLSIGEANLVTAATASIATLSNIGPGLASVGPFGDFSFFAGWQKLLMVGLMWLGRLEFFAVLALFQSRFWRL